MLAVFVGPLLDYNAAKGGVDSSGEKHTVIAQNLPQEIQIYPNIVEFKQEKARCWKHSSMNGGTDPRSAAKCIISDHLSPFPPTLAIHLQDFWVLLRGQARLLL